MNTWFGGAVPAFVWNHWHRINRENVRSQDPTTTRAAWLRAAARTTLQGGAQHQWNAHSPKERANTTKKERARSNDMSVHFNTNAIKGMQMHIRSVVWHNARLSIVCSPHTQRLKECRSSTTGVYRDIVYNSMIHNRRGAQRDSDSSDMWPIWIG